MSKPIVNPEVPYAGEVPGGLRQGRMARIQGVVAPSADRFNIDLQAGGGRKPRDDTALHVSVRLKQGYIARNSYEGGAWGAEEGEGRLPIGAGQQFEVILLADAEDFKIAVNGQHFGEFRHRMPIERVSHLLIDGDCHITLVSWEGSVPSAPASEVERSIASGVESEGAGAPPAQQPGYGAPPQGYGPPQGGYGPPQGAYGPPQGAYGPQQGYGPPPPQGYGPPPPGQHEESGFEHFLSSAQSMLADAIATGAADKLVGGILGPNNQQQQQGFAPQNAQYGQYPHPPQFQQGPQAGGEGAMGGLGGSVTSFLSSLARDVLSPKSNQGSGRGGY